MIELKEYNEGGSLLTTFVQSDGRISEIKIRSNLSRVDIIVRSAHLGISRAAPELTLNRHRKTKNPSSKDGWGYSCPLGFRTVSLRII